MFIRLSLLFVLVPCLELLLLLQIGGRIGFAVTVGLILLTGIVGAWLARWQGYQAVERLRGALGQGRIPADEALDGFLIFTGGVLLITPGILTDLLGLSLLTPLVRSVLRRRIKRAARSRFSVDTGARWHWNRAPDTGEDGDVIDVSATSRPPSEHDTPP